MTDIFKRYSRRTIALFWLALVAIALGVLLYLEQVAIIYVLTTLGLVALLLIVGFADLEKVGRDKAEGFSSETRD